MYRYYIKNVIAKLSGSFETAKNILEKAADRFETGCRFIGKKLGFLTYRYELWHMLVLCGIPLFVSNFIQEKDYSNWLYSLCFIIPFIAFIVYIICLLVRMAETTSSISRKVATIFPKDFHTNRCAIAILNEVDAKQRIRAVFTQSDVTVEGKEIAYQQYGYKNLEDGEVRQLRNWIYSNMKYKKQHMCSNGTKAFGFHEPSQSINRIYSNLDGSYSVSYSSDPGFYEIKTYDIVPRNDSGESTRSNLSDW
ncbi:hypothetical protein [Neglectibacter caecimuris]|uniref:hypothetical protein n=1 Tax=Neglectibacter caecimuris TaxID=3093658 RepID=UPI002AC936B5|nr:hypothetical protein [Neglectibacter sp. M00184]